MRSDSYAASLYDGVIRAGLNITRRAIDVSGLKPQLSDPALAPRTLLAMDDWAWAGLAAARNTTLPVLMAQPTQLQSILLNHMLAGRVFTWMWPPTAAAPAVNVTSLLYFPTGQQNRLQLRVSYEGQYIVVGFQNLEEVSAERRKVAPPCCPCW